MIAVLPERSQASLEQWLEQLGLERRQTIQVVSMRRTIQRRADELTQQRLKGCRWLLVKNRDELTTLEKSQPQTILAHCPQLRTLYLLKEEFRTICDKAKDRPQAERFLRVWIYKAERTKDPFLLKFVQTLRHWWSEFLNYFEDSITSGVNPARLSQRTCRIANKVRCLS